MREYIEDGILKVQFVRSEANDADIFTKNLNTENFQRHSDSLGMSDGHNCDVPEMSDGHDVGTPKMKNRKGVKVG